MCQTGDREGCRMSQTQDRWVQARAMVRSRAWRAGYASARRGEDAQFMERGTKALAYEYGRLTAAWLRGEGQLLPWVSERRPLPDYLVRYMAEALMDCVTASATGGDAPDAEEARPSDGGDPELGVVASSQDRDTKGQF